VSERVTPRLPIAACAALLLAAMLTGVALHAAHLRQEGAAARRERIALAGVLGVADLAVSSHARWLRHPSMSEPAAAFADAAGALDVDPAGAWIAPPRALFEARRIERLDRASLRR
jgi:hypothetical protein